MAGYPITLQLNGKFVLIVGGGKVAARKARAVLEAGAFVTVVSPKLDEAFEGLQVHWIQGEYGTNTIDLKKPALVFAATDDPHLNTTIALHAKAVQIWANVVDDSPLSDFHNMAVVERGIFTIGISSNGASPALLNILKERIAAVLSDGLVTLGTWLGNLRSMAKVTINTQEDRQALYERIVSSEVLALLEAGKWEEAQALFNKLVEEAL